MCSNNHDPPSCISAWPAARVTISPGSGGLRIYAGLSHSISYNPDHHQPHHQIWHRQMSQPEKTFILHPCISSLCIVIRYIHHSLSILPPMSLSLYFSLQRRLNALLWQLIHTFAVEEEKQSFWRKTLRALQTQS